MGFSVCLIQRTDLPCAEIDSYIFKDKIFMHGAGYELAEFLGWDHELNSVYVDPEEILELTKKDYAGNNLGEHQKGCLNTLREKLSNLNEEEMNKGDWVMELSW